MKAFLVKAVICLLSPVIALQLQPALSDVEIQKLAGSPSNMGRLDTDKQKSQYNVGKAKLFYISRIKIIFVRQIVFFIIIVILFPTFVSNASYGSAAIPVAVAVGTWKFILAMYGLRVLLNHSKNLEKQKKVHLEYAKNCVLSYVLLQIPDLVKVFVDSPKGAFTTKMHHAVTMLGFTIDYLYGSDRTLALCTLSLLGDIVGPPYSLNSILRHQSKGTSVLNYIALRTAYWLTILVRRPVFLWLSYLSISDIYYSITKSQEDADIEIYDELQPLLKVPSLAGFIMLLTLDQIWLKQTSKMTKDIAEVIDAENWKYFTDLYRQHQLKNKI